MYGHLAMEPTEGAFYYAQFSLEGLTGLHFYDTDTQLAFFIKP